MRLHVTAYLEAGCAVAQLVPTHPDQVRVFDTAGRSVVFFVTDPDVAEELADRLLESAHALRPIAADTETAADTRSALGIEATP